jgi:hypothetical protein
MAAFSFPVGQIDKWADTRNRWFRRKPNRETLLREF